VPIHLLLYYSSCHALAIACTIFAFIHRGMAAAGSVAPDAARPSRDIRFAILLAFLSLGTVGMAYGFYQYRGAEPDLRIVAICSGISLFGLTGSVFALPFFASAFGTGTRKIPRLFGVVSAVSLACIPAILTAGASFIPGWLQTFCSVFVAVAFLMAFSWSVPRVISAIRTFKAETNPTSETLRWSFTLKGILAFGVCLTPLCMANDFFFLPTVFWGWRFPDILPLLAVGRGVIYLVGNVRSSIRLQRGASESRARESHDPEWPNVGLTPRETEVARLLVSGYTYHAISERLGIAAATVKTHILKFCEKTGAGNKLELLLFADKNIGR
jgi:DNA-binding CsgD family transcriptional regulator